MSRSHPLRKTLLAALVGGALGVGGVVALAEPTKAGFAPDPPVQASRKQWVFELTAQGGNVTPDRARSTMVDKPMPTARVFGRFALELYIGKELLDRVRFNVPLMGGETSIGGKRYGSRPRFEK